MDIPARRVDGILIFGGKITCQPESLTNKLSIKVIINIEIYNSHSGLYEFMMVIGRGFNMVIWRND